MLLQSCRWRCSCCSTFFFLALTSRFLHRSDAFRHFLRPTARRSTTTTTTTTTAVDYQHFYQQPSRFEAYKSDILHGSVTKLRSSKEPQSGASEVKSSSNIRKTRTVRTWDNNFQLLVEYKEQQGDCNVPQKYKQDPTLGRWVNTQRQTKDNLSDAQCAKLDSLGFSWSILRRWDESFHLLVKYKEQHGDCHVSIAYNLDPTLGAWVMRQRQIKYSLSDEQRAKLDDVGFAWANGLLEDQWDKIFLSLQRYANDNGGDCNIPAQDTKNQALAHWVAKQRKRSLFFQRNVFPSSTALA
jgi:hypothetical protein